MSILAQAERQIPMSVATGNAVALSNGKRGEFIYLCFRITSFVIFTEMCGLQVRRKRIWPMVERKPDLEFLPISLLR